MFIEIISAISGVVIFPVPLVIKYTLLCTAFFALIAFITGYTGFAGFTVKRKSNRPKPIKRLARIIRSLSCRTKK
jgi:hypothetical protein